MQKKGKALIILAVIIAGALALTEEKDVTKIKKEKAATDVATFAGGCFWCMESDFEKVDGVLEVISGFSGGKEKNPNYKEVSAGKTGHVETVQVKFNPQKVSYKELVDVFWRHIDPTDDGGQFVDRGSQYKSAIFYHDAKQRKITEASKKELEASGKFSSPIVTPIKKFVAFYPAEDYHQDYYKKSPVRYRTYRFFSGRDQFLKKTWGTEQTATAEVSVKSSSYTKPSEAEIKKMLTPLQYKVTQQDGTEPPFNNEYNNNKREGIYVDIVSGEPLFSSTDKYDSKTGWPSFTKPLEPSNIITKKDFKLIIPRTELRSKVADSHLGHLFKDGPAPTGSRYCINSAALLFIPKEDLEKEGYGEYKGLFENK